jgi:hypothetical protein
MIDRQKGLKTQGFLIEKLLGLPVLAYIGDTTGLLPKYRISYATS